MLLAAFIVFLIALLPSPLQAEARIALLIGNEAYATEIGRLANPHNDVALLEQALKGIGFEVMTVHDAGLGALTRAVNAYARRLQAAGPNAIGFFYYSGHGASDGSTNYLIPTDVKTTETGELWDQSLRLTEITGRLKREAGNATHFVVFDACRNTLKLTQPGSRAVVQSKGFVPVAQESGMLIAYATAEGELATDVGVGAGSYARALAEEIIRPGVEAVVMFRAVQLRVRATIRQEPYVGFSALGNVYLAGKSEQLTEKMSEAAEAWDKTKDINNIAPLEAFIARFKDTYFADLARLRIEELRTRQVAVEPLPPTSRTSKFDGNWRAIFECSAYKGLNAYSGEFEILVKDGVLHGEYGEKDKPRWRALDGKIAPSGIADIREQGIAAGGGPYKSGSRYTFYLSSQFDGTRGTGKRHVGRDCRYTFTKQ